MSIVLLGSTSGSITLQEPAIAGSNTINLPAATGTMALLQTPSFATTIGVGNATPSTSGAGITFPATQSASSDANTLDDYEEGTFALGISDGTTTISNVHTGNYTKIGRTVFLRFTPYGINVSSLNTSGHLRISNLPFPAVLEHFFTAPIFYGAANTNYFYSMNNADNSLYFWSSGNAKDATPVSRSSLGTPTELSFFGTITYMTN